MLSFRHDTSTFWDEYHIESVLKLLGAGYPDDGLFDAIEDGNCGEMARIIEANPKMTLAPAMLWASWKESNNSVEVLEYLISLGCKANQVNDDFFLSSKFSYFFDKS